MTPANTIEITTPLWRLLALLSDGQVHSGQELAAVLGVTRTAVWKQLSKLEVLGLRVEALKSKGYKLVGGIDLLDECVIRSHLREDVRSKIESIEIAPILDSTNAYMLRQSINQGVGVCFAEYQTAGRGRRGRAWVSPFAKNIYLSLAISLESGIRVLEGLSLAVGVAVIDALEQIGLEGTCLKWPNDILWQGKKLGGVLIEIAGDPSGRCYCVVGVGLNLFSSALMEQAITQEWVALEAIFKGRLDRNRIAALLLDELIPLLNGYESRGFAYYHERWALLNAHRNQVVDILMGNSKKSGVMMGVNEMGALVLETNEGIEIFHGGEISLRGMR